jgi:hypothetical protein
MTNDEAIYVLKNTAWLGWGDKQKETVTEAVQMAVEALKTQLPKEDTTSDCISRQEAIRIASGYCHFTNVAKELEKLPSVQPVGKDINVSCKDAISRQGAIDHFKSIADATSMGNKYNEGFVDGLNFAVGHLETMPSVQPDIIRCKDCKHKGTKNCVANAWTTILGVTVKDDFYCGLAEKENR